MLISRRSLERALLAKSAPDDRQHIDIRVEGTPDQLAAFAQLCKTIEFLCNAGASRTVVIPVDGDGAASLRFDFGSTDVTDVAEADIGDDEVRVAGIGY